MPPSTNWTPQANARTAGAIPKLMTSARESISRPKSLVVLVMRAIRPSRPSRNAAAPIHFAAITKCSGAPPAFAAASIEPLNDRRIEIYPRKMLPAVNSVGIAYAARRGRRSGEFGSTSRSLSPNSASAALPGNDTRPRRNPLARRDRDLPLRPQQNVHPRAELDQPNPFPGRHPVPRLLVEHDAP